MNKIPDDAINLEVFAIKPDETGKLFAYIGFNITNGNFDFISVPYTEPINMSNYLVNLNNSVSL